MTAEERKEFDEMKNLLERTAIWTEKMAGNGSQTKAWLNQGVTTVVTALLLAGTFFLFGLPERITAVAEEKAEVAIKHYSEVLEPRLKSIEISVDEIKTNVGKIQESMATASR